MRYQQLGTSSLTVSHLCLGTMTFGQQNSEAEAHQQLDYAFSRGINFIDTAEMYPVPAQAATQGLTETYVGSWLKHQPRDQVIVASKITGPARGMQWIREQQGFGAVEPRLTRQHIQRAIEDSLRRLQTDYLDLYQIHWPDRNVPMFGQTAFDASHERQTEPLLEQLSVFAELIQAGKIRYLGVSNETPWGICEFTRLAEQAGLPRIATVQNAYNLLNRHFEQGLYEACYRQQVGLLAYSPLAFGHLSGKYLPEAPAGLTMPDTTHSRITLFPGFGQRYAKPNVREATQAYAQLAAMNEMTPAEMALAFVYSRPFVASTIIGATSLAQLQENIDCQDFTLSAEVLRAIDIIHQHYPNPAP